jgi:serine/threonine-protein kinase
MEVDPMAAPADPSVGGQRESSVPKPLHASLPRTFGPYTLFEPLGRGGMAELFLARGETSLGATRLVVVKLILPAFADDPKFAEMLIHEAKLAARLSHRHIVQVLDLGRSDPADDGRLYIAMEYVEGFDLNALLRQCTERNEGLPAEHALGIVADVLEGLDYAHRRADDSGAPLGIVHRDVSPSNVLISYDGEVKLCDFGIAHANDLVSSDENETLKGKAGYMSPEHARGEPLDARADVFAAGIILWELLSGRRLYRPRDSVPLLEQARRAKIPPIPDRGLPNHEQLERIVRRALAENRDERYPSAAAFHRDLESYLAGAGLLASRLKLGEWMAKTLGTKMVEERRASERRLPKSAPPPPRSSRPARMATAAASVPIPNAPRVPSELAVVVTQEESIPLILPESLPDATLDIQPSSTNHVMVSEPMWKRPSDEELLAWARKRGVVTFLFFFTIACSIALIWYLTR